MRITLIRHGEAGEDAPRDEERSLTKGGRAEVRRVGQALERAGVHFGAVVTSPLVRAVQTAEITAAAVGYRGRVVVSDKLIPDAFPAGVMSLVATLAQRRQEVGRAGRARAGAVARGGDAAADRPLPAAAQGGGDPHPPAGRRRAARHLSLADRSQDRTPPPSMMNRFAIVSSCALAAIVRGLLGGLGACTPPPPPAKPQIPTRPLDLQMPLEAPDEATMSRLPAAWDAEAASSATKLETGPLQGPGNFNELDGDLHVGLRAQPVPGRRRWRHRSQAHHALARPTRRGRSWRRPTSRSATVSSTRRCSTIAR